MAKEAADSPDSRSSSRASNQQRVLRSSTRQAVAVYSKRENSYSPPLKPKAKKRKKKSTKADAKIPKKPPTAFFYFLEDFRKEFQQQNPDVKSMRDVGKACGEKWKTMTYEEKVKYYDIATEKRAEFDKAMSEYIRKKETSEDQETEDDDDDSEYDG